MLLVVDSNVIISCLIRDGTVRHVFLLNALFQRFELIAPEFLWIEVEKHKEELMEETDLTGNEFDELSDFLREEIDIIPATEFIELLPKAKKALGSHFKDAQYLALAMKYEAKILSGDKKLKERVPDWVVTPRQAMDGIRGR